VWRQCGFPRAPSRDPIKRFRSNFSAVAETIFDYLVEQAARRGLLSPIYRIDSTDVRTTVRDDSDGSWNHDPTADEKYFGYGCTLVTTANNVPVAAAFTDGKQVDESVTFNEVGSASVLAHRPWWEQISEFLAENIESSIHDSRLMRETIAPADSDKS
jgi:hypothetical protein